MVDWGDSPFDIADAILQERKQAIKFRYVYCPLHNKRMILEAAGPHGPYYICPIFYCDMKIGAHPNGKPKGRPANYITRKARIEAHEWFDKLYQRANGNDPTLDRDTAYSFLAAAMGISKSECHIANFSTQECKRVIEICKPARFPVAGT
jgi:hypothetical protein